jgi:UDP-GlcNAc:undecaprenyl-phosphate GlcNAc-1-phosphate transferase
MSEISESLTEILSLLMAAGISALVTWLTIKLYTACGWLDDPDQPDHGKKTHQQPVPRGGGIPIFISFVLTALFWLKLDKYLIGTIISALILTVTGILDDLFNLHPKLRLVLGFLAGLIVVGTGIGIAYVTHPFAPGVIHLNQPQLHFQLWGKQHTIWIIADIFALIFFVWNMNIVNWSKGVDGQLPAFVSVAFLFIGLLSDHFSSDPTAFSNAVLAFILAGGYLGLLIFNWYPQKIMPGYGGGSLAGFFLALLAILSGAKVATTLMVLAIPTADAIFTITRRLLQGKSPLWGDRQHLHHRLLDDLGWGRQRIAIFYTIITALMGILALQLKTTGKLIMLALSFGLVFLFQLSYTKGDQSSKRAIKESIASN